MIVYEESQLEKLLYCSKCRDRFDEPRILPCGNLICQRCIQDIQNLVGILDDSEFHCQICSHFHDFPKIKSFPLCQQVVEFLSIEPKQTPHNYVYITLKSIEDKLNQLDKDEVDSHEINDYLLKLQAHVIKITNETIDKITTLKSSILSDLNTYQSKYLELNKQLDKFNSGSNLTEIKRLHSELKTSINSVVINDNMNDLNDLIKVVKEMVEREMERYEKFVFSSEVLEHGKSLVEIDRELQRVEYVQTPKFNDNEINFNKELPGHTDSVYAVIALTSNRVASGSCDGTIKIWNCITGCLLDTFRFHSSSVNSLAVLDDGKLLSGSWDQTIKVSDVDTGQVVNSLEGHEGVIYCLEIIGSYKFASGSIDGSIKVWDLTNVHEPDILMTLREQNTGIYSLAALSKNRLASGLEDKIEIWNLTIGEKVQTLIGHSSSVSSIKALSDTELASSSWDETIKIWNVITGFCIRTLLGHTNEVLSLGILGNKFLVSGSMDGSIKIWDWFTGQVKSTSKNEASAVYSVAVMANGMICSGWEDKTVKILEIKNLKIIK